MPRNIFSKFAIYSSFRAIVASRSLIDSKRMWVLMIEEVMAQPEASLNSDVVLAQLKPLERVLSIEWRHQEEPSSSSIQGTTTLPLLFPLVANMDHAETRTLIVSLWEHCRDSSCAPNMKIRRLANLPRSITTSNRPATTHPPYSRVQLPLILHILPELDYCCLVLSLMLAV